MGGQLDRVLVVGRFSFEEGRATACDLLACDLVCGWLEGAGSSYEVALAAPFSGGVDWREVDPIDYGHVILLCGPFGRGTLEADFLSRFASKIVTGLDLTRIVSPEEWDPLERPVGRHDSVRTRPDIVFLSRQPLVPVVGVCLVEAYEGASVAKANAAIRVLLGSRAFTLVELDARLDENATALCSAAEIESLIARVDILVTTHLHGMVLALKNGVPTIAIDPEVGGSRLRRQAEAIGWSLVYSVDHLHPIVLQEALTFALTREARDLAVACAARAADRVRETAREFLDALAALSVAGHDGAGRVARPAESPPDSSP